MAVLAMQVWLHTYATEGISQVISDYVLAQLTPEQYLLLLDDSSCAVRIGYSNTVFTSESFGAAPVDSVVFHAD
jgi:hypothetical protein